METVVVGVMLFLGGIVIAVQIAELRAKKLSESKVKQKYYKKVFALEQLKNNFKNKIKGSDDTKTNVWTSFKHSLNHKIDELGQA